MTVTRVSDQTTRPELEEALGYLAAKAKRTPAHWADRYAAIHEAINEALTLWERAP